LTFYNDKIVSALIINMVLGMLYLQLFNSANWT